MFVCMFTTVSKCNPCTRCSSRNARITLSCARLSGPDHHRLTHPHLPPACHTCPTTRLPTVAASHHTLTNCCNRSIATA